MCPVEFAEGAGEAEHCQQAQAVCMLVLLGKKTDFLALQCPTSGSALTGFFPCVEYKLSHPVHVPEECQFDPLVNSLLDVCEVVA